MFKKQKNNRTSSKDTNHWTAAGTVCKVNRVAAGLSGYQEVWSFYKPLLNSQPASVVPTQCHLFGAWGIHLRCLSQLIRSPASGCRHQVACSWWLGLLLSARLWGTSPWQPAAPVGRCQRTSRGLSASYCWTWKGWGVWRLPQKRPHRLPDPTLISWPWAGSWVVEKKTKEAEVNQFLPRQTIEKKYPFHLK